MPAPHSEELNFWKHPGTRTRLLGNLLYHANCTYEHYFDQTMMDHLSYAHGATVLSIGSTTWYYYLIKKGIFPSKLTCINISRDALKNGLALSTRIKDIDIEFLQMDANYPRFPEKSFDFIFGTAILHHLEIEKALPRIRRLLRDNGRVMFMEPLGINPVSKLIRLLTPWARTRHERALGLKDIKLLKELFDAQLHYQQLLSVPFALLSKLLYRRPVNIITRAGYHLDTFLYRRLPFTGPLSRKVVVFGKKP